MTHSLYFVVEFETWEKAKDFKESFQEWNEFTDLYLLVKDAFSYHMRGDSQPFLYFPQYQYGKPYNLRIETGSHVGTEDTLYALHWYYFTLAFSEAFKDELDEYSLGEYYHLEGDDTRLSAEQMLKEIERMKVK